MKKFKIKSTTEEGGAGEEGTDKLVKKYKKDTPYSECVDEAKSLAALARRDAMKHMGGKKSGVDPADVDNDSESADDEKNPHITMQMRKVVTLRGQKPVKFNDGKSHSINVRHAQKFLQLHSSMKGIGKEALQNKAAKSHAHFLKAIGEEVELDEMKMGKEYPMSHVLNRIKSGDYEAMQDVKPGKHVELRHHSGKRVTVKVKEEVEQVDEGPWEDAMARIKVTKTHILQQAHAQAIKAGKNKSANAIKAELKKRGVIVEEGEWKKDSGWHKKPEQYKDKQGNVIKGPKHFARHLAKMAIQKTIQNKKVTKEEVENIDELQRTADVKRVKVKLPDGRVVWRNIKTTTDVQQEQKKNEKQKKKYFYGSQDVEQADEAYFKVDVADLPTMYVDASSESQVKQKLRMLLKKPTDEIKSIERIQPAEVKKAYRNLAAGKKKEEENDED